MNQLKRADEHHVEQLGGIRTARGNKTGKHKSHAALEGKLGVGTGPVPITTWYNPPVPNKPTHQGMTHQSPGKVSRK